MLIQFDLPKRKPHEVIELKCKRMKKRLNQKLSGRKKEPHAEKIFAFWFYSKQNSYENIKKCFGVSYQTAKNIITERLQNRLNDFIPLQAHV